MSLFDNLMERLGNVREYSDYFMASCVFHSPDVHPSLMVHEDGFKCLSCGAKGSLQKLSQKIGAHFFPQHSTSSAILPRWKKWGDTPEEIVESSHRMLLRYPQFQGYLRKRKYENFIEQGYFGYRDGWLVVPVFDAHRKIVDLLVRAVKGKGETRYVVQPGKTERPLYSPNWERVNKASYVYITFGIFDAWAMEAIGEPCVTGITGKAIPVSLLGALEKRGIFLPDKGEEEDAHHYANILGWKYRVKELPYPEGTKDPSGIHEIFGDKVLREMIFS